MKHILQRFSQNAREALVKSQIIARTEAHSFVATHHLLLALTQQPDSLAYKVLKESQVDVPKIAEICNRVIFRQRQETQTQGIEDELKLVIQYAFEEASDLGSVYVGTEHLLLGIIALERSLAAQILTNSKVDPEEIRLKVREYASFLDTPIKQSKADFGDTSTIELYGRDLTQEAAQGKLDPVVGRDEEINRLIQILSRRTKNNPILLGEAGVGKTAIVEGLAQKIHTQEVPANMQGKRVISLNIGALVAGTKFRGDFEERVVRLLGEVKEEGNIILFIDELHTLLGAGSAAGSLDAANILKPLLAKGEIQTIGATTFDEYQEFIEEDAALTRRFQPIIVDEPTVEQTVNILTNLSPMYEIFHGVRFNKASLEAAATLAHRYIAERKLPDAAIDLMDEAASQVKIERTPASSKTTAALRTQIDEAEAAKEDAVDRQQYDVAFSLRKKEQQLRQRLEKRLASTKPRSKRSVPIVQKQDIAQVISRWIGVPADEVNQSESQKLLHLEDIMHQRIVGQEEAIALIGRSLRRARVGLASDRRPIGSFLFLGPSGVGKTETARVLAETVFGDEAALIKFNMSEYMEKYAASNLIGAPAGYVGYEEGGKLTEAVRRRPYAVVLFDEIEKAHPDIYNLLLQVLEDGELVDAKGRRVDFRNTIIVFTSNLGVEYLGQKGRIGFSLAGSMDELEQSRQTEQDEMKDRLLENLKDNFRPEFLNRLGGIVVFHSLAEAQVEHIARLMVEEVERRLKPLRLKLKVEAAVYQYLAQAGTSQELGVRPLRRLIEREIEDPIAEAVLQSQLAKGQSVSISTDGHSIQLTLPKQKLATAAVPG